MDQSIWELLSHGGGAMWVVLAFSVIGHLIGNLDEYMVGSAHYLSVVGRTPVGDPTAIAETDTAGTTRYTAQVSVMGAGGPVLLRHVQGLLTWVNGNLRPGEPPFSFAP